MEEYATGKRACRATRELREIPEFKRYLVREGLTFVAWQKRQKRQAGADATTQALRLARRKLQINHKGNDHGNR